jgi:hypothetical protein
MRTCGICGQKFKNERGLMVHLARTHDIHGIRGRLSIKAAHEFFPLLEERRWRNAQRFLGIVGGTEDEWIRGYSQALEGLLLALKEPHSSLQPYVIETKEYSSQELRELSEDFASLASKPLNTEFDEGYFQAWLDFINHKRSRAAT